MTPLPTVVVLSVAAWRLAHLVVSDAILGPFRDRVENRWPVTHDRSLVRVGKHGWTVHPANSRPKVRPLGPGYLVGCISCVSLWVSVALTAAVTVAYGLPRPVLAALAVAGGALLLDRATNRG